MVDGRSPIISPITGGRSPSKSHRRVRPGAPIFEQYLRKQNRDVDEWNLADRTVEPDSESNRPSKYTTYLFRVSYRINSKKYRRWV